MIYRGEEGELAIRNKLGTTENIYISYFYARLDRLLLLYLEVQIQLYNLLF